MQLSSSNPIGIFDSGIGGLTVAQAIVNALPQENIIYFGDTAHLPYGDKSAATIRAYSLKIAELLLQKKCKLIMIACSSASTAAFAAVKQFVGDRAIVMNVVEPTVDLLQKQFAQHHVGLIGTRQTVNSQVYQQKVANLNCGIRLTARATNLLATAIEEFGSNRVTDSLVEEYLSHADFKDIQALVLACTHYPVIKRKIADFFQHKIQVIDPSDAVALAVKQRLQSAELLNAAPKSQKHFYVSDFTPSFAASAKLFFDENIHLEHYPL